MLLSCMISGILPIQNGTVILEQISLGQQFLEKHEGIRRITTCAAFNVKRTLCGRSFAVAQEQHREVLRHP